MWSLFERIFRRPPPGEGWDLRIDHSGRSSPIVYLEGTNRMEFDFELGDAGTIFCPSSTDWDQRFPWAAGRRREIIERVGAEFVRREFRGYTFEVGAGVFRPQLGRGKELLGFDEAHSDDIIVIHKRPK